MLEVVELRMHCVVEEQARGAEVYWQPGGAQEGGAPGEEADEAVGLALSEAPAVASCILLCCDVRVRVGEYACG